jgi:hypothetical protein
MLVKYFGKVFNIDENKYECSYKVRTEFLQNGLFRFTQPNKLNDKGSEFKLYPYFNEISPSDREHAINDYNKHNNQINPPALSEEDILCKLGIHNDTNTYNPSEWSGFNKQASEQYYRETWIKNIEQFNKDIIESMSKTLGVFSLSTDPLNEHMWVMYATEGTGIAVEFDESHSFFEKNIPQTVSYLKSDRATYTHYNGIELINGIKRKNFNIEKLSSPEMKNLFKRLALSKNESWSQEKEKRIIIDLNKVSNADINDQHHSKHPNISLHAIPFEAFKSIIFGYACNKDFIDNVTDIIRNNKLLSHIHIKHVKHDHFGKLIFKDN